MDSTRKFDEAGFKVDEPTNEAVEGLLLEARKKLEARLDRIRRPRARVGIVESRLGRLLAAETSHGLAALRFLERHNGAETLRALRQRFDLAEDAEMADRTANEIERFFEGDLDAIAHRPVDLSLVESDFQRRALKRLRQVPPGAVVTYRALAAAIGAPDSQRAIGNTMASNPIPIYVPCHRVIRSDGSIGNYGGGVERKLKLLRAEGFKADRDRRVPAGAVYGHWVSHIFCRPTCSSVKRANRKKWIIFADSNRARGSGMRACKICQPA